MYYNIGFSLQTLCVFIFRVLFRFLFVHPPWPVQFTLLCIQINKIRILFTLGNEATATSTTEKVLQMKFLFLMNIIYFCVIPTNAITIVVFRLVFYFQCIVQLFGGFAESVLILFNVKHLLFALRHWNSIIDALKTVNINFILCILYTASTYYLDICT